MSAVEFSGPIMAVAAKEWLKLYKKNPVTTLLITIVTLALIATGIYFANEHDRNKREVKRLKDLQYETQITQLKDTEINIKELLKFIEHQKTNLRQTQDTIENLKEEQKKLKPLVESDQAVVNAIFKAQEERQRSSVWRERWVGFAFGLVASLIASFVWFLIRLSITNSSSGRAKDARH
jgi:sensor c-di-GMP phosphodiesterase-like protein